MVIEFAIDQHERFLALCDPASREYEILNNGLIVRRAKHGHEPVVEISAEMREAQLFLALAHQICPVAVPAIVKAISVSTMLLKEHRTDSPGYWAEFFFSIHDAVQQWHGRVIIKRQQRRRRIFKFAHSILHFFRLG